MADAHSSYCRGEILRHIANNGYDVSDECRPNTAISRLEPIHARWMMKAIEQLSVAKETIKLGWRKAGIRP